MTQPKQIKVPLSWLESVNFALLIFFSSNLCVYIVKHAVSFFLSKLITAFLAGCAVSWVVAKYSKIQINPLLSGSLNSIAFVVFWYFYKVTLSHMSSEAVHMLALAIPLSVIPIMLNASAIRYTAYRLSRETTDQKKD